MKRSFACLTALLCAAPMIAATAADTALYETGPAEDSSFLRFVNGTEADLNVGAAGSGAAGSGAATADAPPSGERGAVLAPADPATGFMPVRAGTPMSGTFSQAGTRVPVKATVAPGEFVTVIATLDAKGALQARTIKEQPDDFNALKASIAFYNVAPRCKAASLQVAGRSTLLFENVADGQSARRSINPIKLSVQLVCDGEPSGAPLSMDALLAGERYTVIGVPGGGTPRLVFAPDTLSN